MAYGIEVLNNSGRIVFNSEQSFPNYYSTSGPVSVNGYGANPSYTMGSDVILLARPQDGESGAVFYSPHIGRFAGYNDIEEQLFGVTDGIKYVKFSRQDNITPASSGYGLEVKKSNGEILFSGSTQYSFNILSVGTLTGVSETTFTCPAGVNFNNVYVTATSFVGDVLYNAAVPPYSPDYWTFFGSLAHFNHSTSVITLRHVYILQGVVRPDWSTVSNYYLGTNSKRDYMIVEVVS